MFGMLLKVSACAHMHSSLVPICYLMLVKLQMIHDFLGFRKKVKTLAKQKDCELVGKWEQSMINHMYWCVVSTSNGDGDMMVAKWLSLENHIHNKHSGHGQLFRRCSHGRLVGRNQKKKWFKRRKWHTCTENTIQN